MKGGDSSSAAAAVIPSKCPHCAYSTDIKHSMKLHLNTHKIMETFSGTAYKCGLCPLMLRRCGPIARHMSCTHKSIDNNYETVTLNNGKIVRDAKVHDDKVDDVSAAADVTPLENDVYSVKV